MNQETMQNLGNQEPDANTPAGAERLIKKLEQAIIQTTIEIQLLSEMQSHVGTLTEEEIASFIERFSHLKRFQYEPDAAIQFVSSLAGSATRREVAFREEIEKLAEFNKHFERDLAALSQKYIAGANELLGKKGEPLSHEAARLAAHEIIEKARASSKGSHEKTLAEIEAENQ